MAKAETHRKLGLRELTEIPRMLGESDMLLIREFCESVSPNGRILEFGPWLGGVSIELAKFGELHVVDRFVWTESNAESYPGLAKPGENFRPLFEALIADYGAKAIVHETLFKDFAWSDGEIDLVFVDGPRKAADLLLCLQAVQGAIRPDAPILIKNGLNPRYPEMMALIHVLAALGILILQPTEQPRYCNIAVLKPGPEFVSLDVVRPSAELFSRSSLAPDIRDPWGGPLLVLARIAERIEKQAWDEAYAMLGFLPPEIAALYAWDKIEAALALPAEQIPALAAFSEVLAWANDDVAHPSGYLSPKGSLIWTLRASWSNLADHPDRARLMQPDMLAAAFDAGRIGQADRLGDDGMGRHVVEIGEDLGLNGVAHLAGGVASYFGVETLGLTSAMLVAETALPCLSYMPIETMALDQLGHVDVLMVHEGVSGNPIVKDLVFRLKSAFPAAEEKRIPAENTSVNLTENHEPLGRVAHE